MAIQVSTCFQHFCITSKYLYFSNDRPKNVSVIFMKTQTLLNICLLKKENEKRSGKKGGAQGRERFPTSKWLSWKISRSDCFHSLQFSLGLAVISDGFHSSLPVVVQILFLASLCYFS